MVRKGMIYFPAAENPIVDETECLIFLDIEKI
jgi:hypothetical protein